MVELRPSAVIRDVDGDVAYELYYASPYDAHIDGMILRDVQAGIQLNFYPDEVEDIVAALTEFLPQE